MPKICHMTAIPQDPGERALQTERVEQAVGLLRESPMQKKTFIAGEERDGVTQVTIASRISSDRISICEMAFMAGSWDAERFQREMDSKSRITPAERLKAAHVANDIGSHALRESEKARRR